MLLVLVLFVVLFLSAESAPEMAHNQSCADFNFAASSGAMHGLENSFVCPFDGIAQVSCLERFPLKIDTLKGQTFTPSTITLDDVVFYVLVGPNSKVDAFKWWLPLLKDHKTDVVLVADPCSDDDAAEVCEDGPSGLLKELQTLEETHKAVSIHLVRVRKADVGYTYLSCKLRTGQKRIYEQFPLKQYFFKFDTDTIIFPGRFLHFLKTLDATHKGGSSNSHKGEKAGAPSSVSDLATSEPEKGKEEGEGVEGTPIYFGGVQVRLEELYSLLVVSCFMWSGALDSSDLLLLYPLMPLASLMTNILISTLKHEHTFILMQESGMNLLLCGHLEHWTKEGTAMGPVPAGKGGLCYAQGGAGYGLNNAAMRTMAKSPPCGDVDKRVEGKGKKDNEPEDGYVAMRVYAEHKAEGTVIHCGGFDSSEVVTDRKMRNSITFHYIDSPWLAQHGELLLRHYHSHNNARGGK